MPIGYGSRFDLPGLSAEQIGVIQKTKNNALTSFFRIAITVAEIGLAFTGIGVVAETAVGLAAGTANQIIDSKNGGTTTLGTILNFGAPFIGGSVAGAKNFTKFNKFAGGVNKFNTNLAKTVEGFTDLGYTTQEALNFTINKYAELAKFDNPWFKAYEVEQASHQTLKNLNTSRLFYASQNRLANVSDISKFNKGLSGQYNPGTIAGINKAYIKNTGGLQRYFGIPTKDLFGSRVAINVSDNLIREAVEDTNFYNYARGLGRTAEEGEALLQAFKTARNMQEFRGIAIQFFERLNSLEGAQALRKLSRTLEKSVSALDPIIKSKIVASVKQLEARFRRAMAHLKKEAKGLVPKTSLFQKMQKGLKYIGSKKFNDKFVQKVQLIDPNDLGRAPIEALYQKAKRGLDKYFAKTAKLLNGMNDIKGAFEKAGGISVASQWHLGYRIIKRVGTYNWVMITYGINTGNLTNVFVSATDKDLRKYRQSPGRFYRNTWALSLGKPVGLNSLFGGTFGDTLSKTFGKANFKQVSNVLGFLPIQALRNVLSLVSNVVENVNDMVTGDYTKNYWRKLSKSFVNTAISRSFRLLGRGVGGGLATNAFGRKVGQFVGRELQRIGGAVFTTGIKNVIAGKSFSKGLGKRLALGVLVSVRSNALRTLRNKRGSSSVIANALTVRRKLEQVKRIPNAVTPGRRFTGGKNINGHFTWWSPKTK